MSSRSVVRSLAAGFALFALSALAGVPVQAQEGAITGTVERADTGQPLDAVQVVVVGTEIGTLTDSDGSFRITGVPPGEQEVSAQLVGYSSQTQTVSVQSGQAATVEFELQQSAVELEQIVVTGTGTGGVQQRKLGNTIGSISGDELENAPTASVSEMLTAREPGLNVLSSSGMSTEGSRIRIRGATSLSQSNEPLVYIDGVRVNSGGGFAGGADAGAEGAGASSRLDDLPPGSIERIEVLKGAAAATLYGTEASNGVIQIFTKSGTEGAARWNIEVENGLEFMPKNRLIPHAGFARNQEQLDRMRERWNEPDLELYEPVVRDLLDDFDETGRQTRVTGSVNGGGEGVTYFVSGQYGNIDGIAGLEDLGPARDNSERWQATGNLNAFTSDELRVNLSTNYSFVQQNSPSTANNIYGAFPLLNHTQIRFANCDDHAEPCNYYGSPTFATVEEAMQQAVGQEVNHFRTSLQGQYQPSQALSLHSTVGADIVSNESWEQMPFGWDVDDFTSESPDGIRTVGTDNQIEVTGELRGGWETTLGESFSSSFTVGTQSFLRQSRLRGGTGDGFGGPGLENVNAASQHTVDEALTESVNIGAFAQEQIGYDDFLFVTVGGRYDVNSAFGEETQGAFYPKASTSIVFSDLEGWNSETFSTVRVRGAWGQSGLQPNSFAQFRTFAGIGSDAGPGVEPQNLGNPDISPEVSTEYEAGLELGLLNDRVSLEGTWWTRTVNDALVERQFPVSGGFTSTQLVNVAQLDAHGFDISANATAVQGEDVTLNVFANAAYLSQNVTDMGGAPLIKTGGSYSRNRNFLTEGLPPGAFLGAKVQRDEAIPLDLTDSCEAPTEQEALNYFSQPRNPSDFEVLAEDCGTADVVQNFLGNPWPDWSGSLGADVRFLDNFQFRAMAEYNFGHQIQDLSGVFRRSNPLIGRNTPRASEVEATLLDPSSSAEDRLAAAQTWARELRGLSPMAGMNQIYDADWIRWREASLTYNAPQSLASTFSMRTLSFSLRARNVAMWVNDDYPGLDPELNNSGRCAGAGQSTTVDCNFLMGQEAWRVPIPRRFSLSVSAGF